MSDSEDDLVTFGTALEPLDKDNLPRKKAISVEEQCAFDAQGRRRFHGAFTGGFSAGYFNSVGSRDGWRPQQFKSSRSSKASSILQNPEDFMDEEDTAEFGFAPSVVRTTKDYSCESTRKDRRRDKKEVTGPIPGIPVLQELLLPVRERIGIILLRKMGWKPGQGVGVRLTRKEKSRIKNKQIKQKIYGCALPPGFRKTINSESETEDSSDDEFKSITFAPDDYEHFRCNPKDNFFGIGYSGLDRRPILSSHINLFEDAPTFVAHDKNKKLSVRGQAFGVGAFENEDDDIFAKDDMSQYDFTLGPEKKKSRWDTSDKKIASNDCIEGFVLSKKKLESKNNSQIPDLPKDFQPFHEVKKSRFSPLPSELVIQKSMARHEMNAKSRAKIINDDRPTIINSVNSAEGKKVKQKDNVPAKIIERSLNLYGKEQVAERLKLENENRKTGMSWLNKIAATSFVKGETLAVDTKILGKIQSKKSLENTQSKVNETKVPEAIRPRFANQEKQQRFEKFLEFSGNERKVKFSGYQPLSMTEWERDQEFIEFQKAAEIYKRSHKENQEEKITSIDIETLSGKEKMIAAAKMNMFGKNTHTVAVWKPEKLVCVRFNISEPSSGCQEGNDNKKKKCSIFDSIGWSALEKFEASNSLVMDVDDISDSKLQNEASKNDQTICCNDKDISQKDKHFLESYEKIFNNDLQNINSENKGGTPKVDGKTVLKTSIQEKRDLFQAIFLSSSEDSDSDKETNCKNQKIKEALLGKNSAELNLQRNTSPPTGIFANVDLENLRKLPVTSETLNKERALVNVSNSEVEQESKRKKPEQIPTNLYSTVSMKTNAAISTSDFESNLAESTAAGSNDDVHHKSCSKLQVKKKSKKEKKKHKHKKKAKSSKKKSKKYKV